MLSEKIYTLRRKNGLSQEQLAEKIGVSRQAISKWEGGLSTPELDKLRALCQCFHITMDQLTDDGAGLPAGGEQTEKTASLPVKTKLGIVLCLLGAVSLIAAGILIVTCPAVTDRLNQSSTVTLKGSGMVLWAGVLAISAGGFLILRKK